MDITRIFRSRSRTALLRLYFTNPENEYYLRELERLLGIPVSMIRKELRRLEEEGIFLSQKKGNLVYFRIDKTYPLFSEYKSIVFKSVGVEGALRQILDKIKGVEVCFIYGSFAKNSENVKSDVDLFVMGIIDEDSLVREINKAERMFQREINYTLYTRDEFKKKRAKKDSFILSLIENRKIFLKGAENDL
jgi:predicted nucleotidyltransferase